MTDRGVYHAGEIAVQERAGERAIARRRESMIGTRLADGARAFLATQTVAAVAAEHEGGELWASMWCGLPGFVASQDDGARVEVIAALDRTPPMDPARGALRAGGSLGMLVIDLGTRRRLRINGSVTRVDERGLGVDVHEVFGNCPKYIQRREHCFTAVEDLPARAEDGSALDEQRMRFIAQADTAFVASIHPQRGLDVSHRGGPAGFARVVDPSTLKMPDYPGNSMFQTLGNFIADARASIAFVDFERGRVLSLTGSSRLDFGTEDTRSPTLGTGRYWSFTVDRWLEFPLPTMMRWTLVERSPFNPSGL
jgi:uncharacterized protein